MSSEDVYPHFDFNFQRIRGHWRDTLGNYSAAAKYLSVVSRRLEYWLRDLGSWIDFDFAVRHLNEDLNLCEAESHLVWLALRHRVRLTNQQRSRLAPADSRRDHAELPVDVPLSSDGIHDRVWHEDFRHIYKKAMARERRELRKLRETGFLPASESTAVQKTSQVERVRVLERPRLQWIWANRLLAYLFETLRKNEAICDDGEMWAALDGVFRDRNGEPISRKDLALWAHQYHNNKSCEDESGKPKKHELIDQIVRKIEGKDITAP